MAINKNHLFDELLGIKCAIVESDASAERTTFIKELLEYNNYKVIVAPMPPPKVAPSATPAPTEGTISLETSAAPIPEKFIIGVTHVSFNVTNAIFGRLLRTPDGTIVTMNYWLQKEKISRDDIPYFDN